MKPQIGLGRKLSKEEGPIYASSTLVYLKYFNCNVSCSEMGGKVVSIRFTRHFYIGDVGKFVLYMLHKKPGTAQFCGKYRILGLAAQFGGKMTFRSSQKYYIRRELVKQK